MDLKYAYYGINLYQDNHHIFAFIIQGLDQLQPIRMLQDSKWARFTINEFIYCRFGILYDPSYLELSLLNLKDGSRLLTLTLHINDFCEGFPDFKT